MNNASAILAASAPTSQQTVGTGTIARPINRRPLPSGYVYPDQAQNGTVLVNIADGTIEGETPDHVAITVGGQRYETKASSTDLLATLKAHSREGSWDDQGDVTRRRKMLTKFFLDNGVSMSWLRPVASMTPEARNAILADLDALASL